VFVSRSSENSVRQRRHFLLCCMETVVVMISASAVPLLWGHVLMVRLEAHSVLRWWTRLTTSRGSISRQTDWFPQAAAHCCTTTRVQEHQRQHVHLVSPKLRDKQGGRLHLPELHRHFALLNRDFVNQLTSIAAQFLLVAPRLLSMILCP